MEKIFEKIDDINNDINIISQEKIFLNPVYHYIFLIINKFLFIFHAFWQWIFGIGILFLGAKIIGNISQNSYTYGNFGILLAFFVLWIIFYGIFKILDFFDKKIEKYFLNLKDIKNGFSLQNEKSFLYEILYLPKIFLQKNLELKNFLKNPDYKNFYKISENVLFIAENTSKKRDKIQAYFIKKYSENVDFLILQEIQLLQNILEYSFHHQIQNHNTIISEISNLQNNEWKDFSEILELQKTRLENQKNIFEKILQK